MRQNSTILHDSHTVCVNFAAYLDNKTSSTIATFIVHSTLDYCNSLHYNLQNTQPNHLQHIQNSLARGVIRAAKSSRVNRTLRSLHGLKINDVDDDDDDSNDDDKCE